MIIQWFPGHMAKTRKLIAENLKLVDMVIEIADARLPLSSRNPFLAEMIGEKPQILVLNKADIADDKLNREWISYYKNNGIKAILTDSRDGKVFENIKSAVDEVLANKIEKRIAKGIVGKTIRIMVTGVPNVGKSTFINNLSGRKSAKTGDRPGVTTGKQWINIKGIYDLLDTPGMLWNKFEDQSQGVKLAFSGAIKDTILDTEELSVLLLEFLRDNYKDELSARYKLDEDIKDKTGYEILEDICRKRGFIVSGGEFNTERAANILLDEFRAAKIGRITLEKPARSGNGV